MLQSFQNVVELAEMEDVEASCHPLTDNVLEYAMAEIILTDLPKTRQAAIDCGSKYYFTGNPCKHGHLDRFDLNSTCYSCKRASADKANFKYREKRSAQEKKWRENNKIKVKEYREIRKKTHIDRDRLFQKKWRQENKIKLHEKNKKYYKDNKQKLYAQARKWQKENPELIASYRHNRRALVNKAGGIFSKEDIKRIYGLQKSKCACCRTSLNGDFHIDHIISLINGGSNWPKNLQLLCPSCNWSKNAKDPIDFMQSRGFPL